MSSGSNQNLVDQRIRQPRGASILRGVSCQSGVRLWLYVVSLVTDLTKVKTTRLSDQRQSVFDCLFEISVTEADSNKVFVVVILINRLNELRWTKGLLTSSVCISQGGGDDFSTPKMASNVAFVYLKSVSALSCCCRDCRRYLHPRSAGVPCHDDTLSVSSQSDVSSCLKRRGGE